MFQIEIQLFLNGYLTKFCKKYYLKVLFTGKFT